MENRPQAKKDANYARKRSVAMVDRYTKTVLTVIALCLVINVVRDGTSVTSAVAQSGPVHVIVDQVASYALQYAGPLHVACDTGCK